MTWVWTFFNNYIYTYISFFCASIYSYILYGTGTWGVIEIRRVYSVGNLKKRTVFAPVPFLIALPGPRNRGLWRTWPVAATNAIRVWFCVVCSVCGHAGTTALALVCTGGDLARYVDLLWACRVRAASARYRNIASFLPVSYPLRPAYRAEVQPCKQALMAKN